MTMTLYKATADGNVPMTPEEEAEFEASRAPVVQVPQVVTMRQARLALLAAGKLPAVTTAIYSLPSPQKEAAVIEWEYSGEVHRNKELVLMLAPALQLDAAGLDSLFIEADKL
jgi:hypothetical protein